ncbi:unnamed protein product [Brachionus calyciflorus]|uniref:Dipeptidyl peptidase 1 n=1 Tax=Brachionus calyciflorus TaxID=104777 RepID=A0A813RKA7_9BILA|nr:unnamed protein product [Brachionus calyciflorus]
MSLSKSLCAFILFTILSFVASDTPADCRYDDIRGEWTFYEGPRTFDKNYNCSAFANFTQKFKVNLLFPNTATDEDGNVGYWTMIYNQGFELVIGGRKYFAFSYFRQEGDNVTSFCKHTFVNSSHDVGVDPKNWSCFVGSKEDNPLYPTPYAKSSTLKFSKINAHTFYRKNLDFIESINRKQKSWKARHYDFMEKMTIGDLIRMSGGKKTIGFQKPKPTQVIPEIENMLKDLPDSFDWRNVSGINYVSPIRTQQTCGSCYAFASLAMHEARLRIYTNNSDQTIFSTQDIVECSRYSQGCDGGFPYLVAGKYAEDYGLVDENCNPYKGIDGKCHTDPKCFRHYATKYRYIGGFYGACNEALMRISLVKNGPIAVSFEVYPDFRFYESGIYHHTGLEDKLNFRFDPFEITNHVVVIVGYGSENGQDYWIVKNSWGTGWGEKGFFRIRRGNDECSIESIAMEADIIVDN